MMEDFQPVKHLHEALMHTRPAIKKNKFARNYGKLLNVISDAVAGGINDGSFREVEPCLAAAGFIGTVREIQFDPGKRFARFPIDWLAHDAADVFITGGSKDQEYKMGVKFGRILKKLAPALLLIVGIAAVIILIKTGPKPVKRAAVEHEYLVNAIAVTPWISAYGEVESDQTWEAVAQVPGKAVWKSPKLKSGEFFKTGEVMLRIDDREVNLSIQKSKAEIKKYLAKIKELKSQKTNMESRLEILKKSF
jgi:hypothetical protein